MNKNTPIPKQSATRPATEQSCPKPGVQGLNRGEWENLSILPSGNDRDNEKAVFCRKTSIKIGCVGLGIWLGSIMNRGLVKSIR